MVVGREMTICPDQNCGNCRGTRGLPQGGGHRSMALDVNVKRQDAKNAKSAKKKTE